jgi:3-dehydroquinate dehydratase-2
LGRATGHGPLIDPAPTDRQPEQHHETPTMSKPVYVLNGPNLNLLGTREPHIYGTTTLAEVENLCREKAKALGLSVVFHQSNHEGRIIDWIQEAIGHGSAIVINPAGFTTTSIAILDALKMFPGPIVEVHISNIHKREEFRHKSYVAYVATGTIAGLGVQGYTLALEGVARLLAK